MPDSWFDPQSLQEQLKRLLADLPDQLASGVARLVRDAPDERLQQVMRSPARRVILDAVFRQLPKYFDRERAKDITATVQWDITGGREGDPPDSYWLEVDQGQCRVSGEVGSLERSVTIAVDGADFLGLVTGNSDPMQAYMAGRIVITGDVMLAAQLITAFRLPTGRR